MPHLKTQGVGGSGKYANKGSCTNVVTYLQHEDMERAAEGLPVEPFFNNDYDKVSSKEVTYMVNHNKGQLHRNDSKFFVLTISPSEKEIEAMGKTQEARATAFKEYIRDSVISKYAENFNKNLDKKQIMYYAKIHHDRDKSNNKLNMHCHIIVSRKCINNKLKLSPQTNHKNTSKGAVKGGFNRSEFYKNCEKTFDQRFNYNRSHENSFEFFNAMKNGSLDEIKEQAQKLVEKENSKNKTINKSINQSKEIEL